VTTQLTLPSTALNTFKHLYYNPEMTPVGKNPYDANKLIKKSYFESINKVYIPYLRNSCYHNAGSLYLLRCINN
jgi:hypothetical protein